MLQNTGKRLLLQLYVVQVIIMLVGLLILIIICMVLLHAVIKLL